jgi:hypothetical protein
MNIWTGWKDLSEIVIAPIQDCIRLQLGNYKEHLYVFALNHFGLTRTPINIFRGVKFLLPNS